MDNDGYLCDSIRRLIASSKEIRSLLKIFKTKKNISINTEYFDIIRHKKQSNIVPEHWMPIEEVDNFLCYCLEKVLHKIQALDPLGIGARNLQECVFYYN